MNEPEAPPKSLRYLIVAYIGWEAFIFLPIWLLNFAIGQGYVDAVSPDVRVLLIETAKLTAYAIGLLCAYVQGRLIGHGDLRAGLGYQPISRPRLVTLMVVPTVALAVLWDIVVYEFNRGAVYRQYTIDASSPWLSLLHAFESVLLAPVSEELFYRGWLWTGLRKRWGALPTAVLTGAAWLGPHLQSSALPWLLGVAVILSVTRHFGQSPRASMALHILYNFIVLISPRVLHVAGLL
jgi:membrane protease YdiL (CAAX protease family)